MACLTSLLPEDLVMADKVFTIRDGVALKHAQLVIPAFTKGKEQLDPIDVEKTRGIAHVRIHVERVIGLQECANIVFALKLPLSLSVSFNVVGKRAAYPKLQSENSM